MRVLVASEADTPRLIRELGPSHLVRLVSPGATVLQGEDDMAVLTLSAHDIAAPRPGLVAPDAALVARLLAFSDGWTGARPLLCQCWAGVSRSTAAAFAIACQKRPRRREDQIAQALRQASPQATPNPLIVALADAALGRQGRMSAAVERLGRGEDFQGFATAGLGL